MEPTLAFNTIASFVTNTNLQHYSGETGLSYFSQMFTITFLQFVTRRDRRGGLHRDHPRPGREPAHAARQLLRRSHSRVRPRVPAAGAARGRRPDLAGHADDVRGGGAARRPSRGGSRRSPGASRPEKWPSSSSARTAAATSVPTPRTRSRTRRRSRTCVETWSITIIPMAMVWMLGDMVGRRRLAVVVFATMLALYLPLVVFGVAQEAAGNPAIAAMGVDQSTGSMEGKEVRFGAGLSALWARHDDGDVERVGELDARLVDAPGRPGADDRHVAEQHLRRRGRRLHQHADLHRRGRLRRRHDDRPHAGVPGQEGRGQGDEAGQPGAAVAPAGDPGRHRDRLLRVGDHGRPERRARRG